MKMEEEENQRSMSHLVDKDGRDFYQPLKDAVRVVNKKPLALEVIVI
jgi:hypothetical protein